MKDKDRKTTEDRPDENRVRMAFEKLDGEPNLWYDRFHKFCLYGPSRSLKQCYRDVMAERAARFQLQAPASTDSQASKELPRPKRNQLPGAWKKRVKEFDWLRRAEAWDAEQRRIAAQYVVEAMNMIREAAPEAAQCLINFMRGEVKDADGKTIPNNVLTQMRLAANSILNRAGVVYDGLQAKEEDGTPEILGIMIHRSEE